MADKVFLQLNDRWALGYDELQWMVMKWAGVRRGWCTVSFISDSTPVMLRILREKGVEPTPAALRAVEHLPGRFRDWYPRRREWVAEHVPPNNEETTKFGAPAAAAAGAILLPALAEFESSDLRADPPV